MSQDATTLAAALLRDTQNVTIDPVEAEAAVALARTVSAVIAKGTDARMTLDEAPWSYDTLRALTAAGEQQ